VRVLSIVSTKGGVGKTTLSVHLAVAANAAGEATLVLDLDQQSSAVQWWKDRQRTFAERKLKAAAPFEVRRASENHLVEAIEGAEGQGFSLVVIDTPPHADFPAARAIEVADLVLMPSRPGYFDLHAAKATIALVRDMKKPAFFVMNQVPHNALMTGADASDFLEAKGIKKAPLHVTLLQPYVRALRDGLTAPEIVMDGRHAGEIGDLWRWTNAQLGIAQALRKRTPARAANSRRRSSSTVLLGDPYAGLELPDVEEGAA
jgi:chromosome partitioning protein